MEPGNPGDVEPVGIGVSEMRIAYDPGYRLYFVSKGRTVVVLLCGGDKSSQDAFLNPRSPRLRGFFFCPTSRRTPS